MKRSDAVLCVFVPVLMLFTGCLEENVRTTISADGSSEREISLKSSSTRVPENAFPLPGDSTWTVHWKKPGEKDSLYEYSARKKFQNPEDLAREYAALTDTGKIGISVKVNKTFEWFFTYLEYEEIYSYRNPFGNVPVTDYLTKEEIVRYVRGDKSDTLKKKVEKWEMRDIYEEHFKYLLAEVKRRNDPALPADLLSGKKEELFNRLMAVDSAEKKEKKSAADSTKEKEEGNENILKIFADVLGTGKIYEFRSAAEEATAIVDRKAKVKVPESWNYSVQMPGLILQTNGDVVEGNTISWKFGLGQVKVGDYHMRAASRATNVWAFVVTGIVALVVVLLSIRTAFRRQR